MAEAWEWWQKEATKLKAEVVVLEVEIDDLRQELAQVKAQSARLNGHYKEARGLLVQAEEVHQRHSALLAKQVADLEALL